METHRIRTERPANLNHMREGLWFCDSLHVILNVSYIAVSKCTHIMIVVVSTRERGNFLWDRTFVTGVQKDKDAVCAGLTLPWSNGPLEGNVNRLKLMKRSMYGRAEIDLLKPQVLYQSKKNQDRKNKRKNHQAQQVDRLKKRESMKSNTNFQHTTTNISKVA